MIICAFQEEIFGVFFLRLHLAAVPWGLLCHRDKITAPPSLFNDFGTSRPNMIQINFSFGLTVVFFKLLFVTFRTASEELIRISNGEVLFNSIFKLLYSTKSLKHRVYVLGDTNMLP